MEAELLDKEHEDAEAVLDELRGGDEQLQAGRHHQLKDLKIKLYQIKEHFDRRRLPSLPHILRNCYNYKNDRN